MDDDDLGAEIISSHTVQMVPTDDDGELRKDKWLTMEQYKVN